MVSAARGVQPHALPSRWTSGGAVVFDFMNSAGLAGTVVPRVGMHGLLGTRQVVGRVPQPLRGDGARIEVTRLLLFSSRDRKLRSPLAKCSTIPASVSAFIGVNRSFATASTIATIALTASFGVSILGNVNVRTVSRRGGNGRSMQSGRAWISPSFVQLDCLKR
jgi:hypothetical protein